MAGAPACSASLAVTASCAPMQTNGGFRSSSRKRAERLAVTLNCSAISAAPPASKSRQPSYGPAGGRQTAAAIFLGKLVPGDLSAPTARGSAPRPSALEGEGFHARNSSQRTDRRQSAGPIEIGVVRVLGGDTTRGDEDTRLEHASHHGAHADLLARSTIRSAGVSPPHLTSFTLTPSKSGKADRHPLRARSSHPR